MELLQFLGSFSSGNFLVPTVCLQTPDRLREQVPLPAAFKETSVENVSKEAPGPRNQPKY